MGNLIDVALNPREELPRLQRKFVQADIAGAGIRAGFNQPLNEQQVGFLYDQGVTGENAGQVFGKLVEAEELFQSTDMTEADIGVDDQLALVAGDARVGQEVERRAGKRVAAFQAGGSFAAGKTGIAGLGTASKS